MRMSTIATSGCSVATAAASDRASAACHDVDAVRLEHVRDPLTNERRVVGDHGAHGTLARIVCRSRRRFRRSTSRRAPRCDRAAGQPGARLGGGAGDPVVSDRDREHTVAGLELDPRSRRARVLATFVRLSATRK
jgi:hypothetical protein